MPKKDSVTKKIRNEYKRTKKFSLAVYLVLRILVIICMISQILLRNYYNAFLCVLTLFLFTLPTILEDRLKIMLPSTLEAIIYIFIFAAEILGEINNFYGAIPFWDTMLHTINGFICAGIGFALIDILNTNDNDINLSPFYLAFVAFCFSMTVGVCWEFFEYAGDKYFYSDMQKDTIVTNVSSVLLNGEKINKAVKVDNILKTEIYTDSDIITIDNGYLDIGLNDTMKDLFVNFIGAIVFSVIGYIHVKKRDEKSFATNFIPVRQIKKEVAK